LKIKASKCRGKIGDVEEDISILFNAWFHIDLLKKLHNFSRKKQNQKNRTSY
jgi:hypothetical protein